MSIDEIVREDIARMPKRFGDLASVMRRGRRRRFVRHGSAAVSSVAVAAVAFVGVNLLLPGSGDLEPAVLSPADSASENQAGPVSHLPRMIIDLPGFEVLGGSETYTGTWEVTFDGYQTELGVLPAGARQRTRDDMTSDGLEVTDVEVAGKAGFIAEYGLSRSLLAWADDDHSVELDGIRGGASEAARIAQTVTYVDEATWRNLLPADLVLPEDRQAAVEDLLRGITLPPDLTTEYLTGRDGFLANAIMSEPDLIVTVTAEVSCRWIETWIDATDTRNGERVSEAVEAMSQSHHWPALDRPGVENWKSIITGYADAMADDGTIGDTPVANSYQSLGCSRYELPAPFVEQGDSVVTTTIP